MQGKLMHSSICGQVVNHYSTTANSTVLSQMNAISKHSSNICSKICNYANENVC
jgi:hypothetical protein